MIRVSHDHDVIVVGAGHNGLVAATLLAGAGQRVLVLERADDAGGAAVSAMPFAGFDARISRYAYLVSLFPRWLLNDLGVAVELRRRAVASYTPLDDAGVLICDDDQRTRDSVQRTFGWDEPCRELHEFAELTTGVARAVFDTLWQPLPSREALAGAVGERAWQALFARPLGEVLETSFGSDLVRGIVATDALIGTFAALDGADLRQNRCFLYHVIGNRTGHWDVPVGGMGALSRALARAAVESGASIRPSTVVEAIDADAPVPASSDESPTIAVRTSDGAVHHARHVLANVAPAVLARLLGAPPPQPAPEGSQLKLNLLLRRLPHLRDDAVRPEEAFAGTFHVNEGYLQLGQAYAQAISGQIPDPAPCEAYCHTLTDPSILGPQLQESGAHTLTVFALHMPARLFAADHDAAKQTAVDSVLRSLNSVLAEPIEDCLLRTSVGEPCLEARTPVELEAELGLPGGHIFHRDLAWPFAESHDDVGRWGVETERPNVWLCGAGARRGGGVSGIPGHNAARAVLAADAGAGAGAGIGATG